VIRCFIAAACCVFTVIAVSAQAVPDVPALPSTEQVETGLAGIHGGLPYVPYRIRLLPVSSFPQLPTEVAMQLERLGCMVPQTYEAREPENVIDGSFEKKGSNDWAVLCSVNQVSTLYVFFQSDLASPIALRHQPDSEWLGVEWSLDYGSAWGIARRAPRMMPYADNADHDGIDDAFVEKSDTVHYFEDGHWTTIDGSQ
jgi:hypothetical protein